MLNGVRHRSVGRSDCLRSHSPFSRQGERKRRAKRISPNPCWFFLFVWVKEDPNLSQMPLPAAKWALCNLSLIVWSLGGFLFFVSLKVCLFGDEIRAIREPWNDALQVTSAVPDKSFRRKKKIGVYSKSNLHNSRQSNHSWFVLHSSCTVDSPAEAAQPV